MASPESPPGAVHVLVEGDSDVAAVEAAARVLGTDLRGVRLVSMGGVTNLPRFLAAAQQDEVEVRGLCDGAEAGYVARSLRHAGYDAAGTPDSALPACGFWICERDLEDELVRAAGAPLVLDVLAATGLARSFETMTHQPAWRDRPFTDQVRRFAGAGSGRKALLARAIAGALAADRQPAPLVGLLDSLPAR